MADEDQTNQPKLEEVAAGGPAPEPPPPPPIYQIPEELLLKWIGVPEDAVIASPLRRRDVDNLIIGMLRLADAQAALDATLVLWSNGKQLRKRTRRLLTSDTGTPKLRTACVSSSRPSWRPSRVRHERGG